MKMVMAIVQAKDADACSGALTNAGFSCTRFSTFGGFLDRDNVTLMVGVDVSQVDEVIGILRSRARRRNEVIETSVPIPAPMGPVLAPPVDVEVGGATVFVLDVDRFEKL